MEDISIIGALIGITVTIGGFLITIFKYFDRKMDRVNDKISVTENTLTAHAVEIDNLDKFVGSEEFRKWIAYSYEKGTENKKNGD